MNTLHAETKAHGGQSLLTDGLGVADPSCFNCDALGGGLYRVHPAPAQWFIGHADGGGQYACAYCKDLLFDALPIETPNVKVSALPQPDGD